MLDQDLVLEYIRIPDIVYNERFRGYSFMREDLLSEGLLGVCMAIQNYNENVKYNLTSYVFSYVRGFMYHYAKKYKTYDRSCNDIILYEETKSKSLEQLYQENKIHDYIKQLPNKDRFMLYEIFWNVKRRKEVIKTTGYCRQGVVFRKNTILKKLTKLMNGEKLTISEKYEKSYGELAKELGMKYSTFIKERKKKGGEEYLMARIGLKNILKDLKRR